MQQLTIQNANNERIAVTVEQPENPIGTAVVMHGLGGFKEQPHIETFAKAFVDNDFTTIRFDTRHTFGESDGQYETATTTNYYEDLETVCQRAKQQKFFKQPFILAGHSLGGLNIIEYTYNFPRDVAGLAPIATSLGGKSFLEAKGKDMITEREKTGRRSVPSKSKPGIIKKLSYNFVKDMMHHEVLEDTQSLTIPILLAVGNKDTSTPPTQQQQLYEKIPDPKEIHTIQGASHTYREAKHLQEIYHIFDQRIKKHFL